MIFRDRQHAATLLTEQLLHLRGKHPLVLAIPRGSVPMGALIADALEGELDVVLVSKLGFPNNPELAIGALDEDGTLYLNEHVADFGVPDEYIARERAEKLSTIETRRALYTPVRPAIDPRGRIVVLVDDGIATGFTMSAALHATRQKDPLQLIVAVPVAPPDALKTIEEIADDVVCLHAASDLQAVGQFYEEFREVSEEDVMALLGRKRRADANKTGT